MADEYRGLFQYERLPELFFRCGCLGHLRLECTKQMQEPINDKLWYGSWMIAGSVARTLIIWALTKEEIRQEEEEEAAMMNLLIDPGQGQPSQEAGPSHPRSTFQSSALHTDGGDETLQL